MSANNFPECFALVLKNEGGYVDNPADPGGATNLGCTKAVWEAFVGHEVSEADIKALTPNDVMPLYRKRYWDAVRGDDLPDGVDYAVFDFALNSGTGRAVKILQKVLGTAQDGQIGPETLALVNAANPRTVASQVCDARLAFLQGLATWNDFGRGWKSRVAAVEEKTFDMAA